MHLAKKIYCRIFQKCFHLALPFLPYREPKILPNMEAVASLLEKKKISRILVITDAGIASLGLMNPLLLALEKHNVKATIYKDTVANPTITNVEEARTCYLSKKCQAIIGFGGGSSMDCAKITAARVAKPRQSVSKMRGILKILKKLPLLIAIPTTAGTGSETTLAAVITNDQNHHKYPINDFCLIPKYAVLDANVTLKLPKHITGTTGMDALTHAVEAYIGRSTTPHTRSMAEKAVTLIYHNLKRAYDNGMDVEARTNMLHAAYCAGIAFTQSYVGYIHGIAHSLGGQYGTPHGLANAVILPHFLREYGPSCHKRLGTLAKRCGIAAPWDSNAVASEKFIDWIDQMNQSMDIPKYLDGILMDDIPVMAAHADKECNPLYPVPKLMDAKELEKMYDVVAGR